MKTKYTSVAALAFMAVVSGSTYAEGSKIEDSEFVNSSANTNNMGLALGYKANANTGSISVQDSEVKGSTLVNTSINSNNMGLALGAQSNANTGSIDIK